MDNTSKMTIDDSSSSMYFSFNSTAAYKMHMESAYENSMAVGDEEECDQNNTLEAEEANQPVEQIQTIKKLSVGVSPAKAIPKNILKAFKALSSTPTKAQLLRSVEVNRGSAAVAVDVCDLGLAFLEAPQESINSVLSEDKENQPQESQEIVYSETSSEIVISVIEKTQEEEKPVKRVGFSNLPVLKSSGNFHVRGGTPKLRRSIPRHEPDLATNRPSRITANRLPTAPNVPNLDKAESNSDEIPKMLSSILKISKGQPLNRKSTSNVDNPFNLLGKATRMSIVKTTLNSPARKVSRKSVSSVQVGKNSMRLSNVPINKGKITAATSMAAPARKSAIFTNGRKSILPTSVTSPRKRIVSLSTSSRKSIAHPVSTSSIQNARKSMALKPSTSTSYPTKNKTTASGLDEYFVCEVCSRKFLVMSLFEAHKRSHTINSATSSSTKYKFSSENDNKCRYCDKKFSISKALANHLIQNCTKIPPGDKKKLLFPTDQPISAQPKPKLPPKSLSTLSSCDSLSSTSNINQLSRTQTNTKTTGNGSITMAPPSANNKLKKKLAHSGVYCTPNKQIICHICKTSFNNILAFTDHKLSHSNATTDDANSTVGAISAKAHIDDKNDGTRVQETLEEVGVPLKHSSTIK